MEMREPATIQMPGPGVLLVTAPLFFGVVSGWLCAMLGVGLSELTFFGWSKLPWWNVFSTVVGLVVGNVVLAVLLRYRSQRRFRERLARVFIYEILCGWFVLVVFPIVWVYLTSAKPSSEVFIDSFGLPKLSYTVRAPKEEADETGVDTKTVTLAQSIKENYGKALFEMNFARQFLNSCLVVGVALMLILVVSSTTAYVLARFRFRASRVIFYLFLAGLMLPMQLALIPLFFEFRIISQIGTAVMQPVFNLFGLPYRVSLFDNLVGLTLIYVGISLPFSIMVLVGFFRTLPEQLREAAVIDGASEWQTFWHVMLPLARPGIVTIAIFNFLGLWNEYIYALTFINSDRLKTVPLGLANIAIVAMYRVDYGMLFAGLVILITPTIVIYILLQKRLTKGITMGALKG